MQYFEELSTTTKTGLLTLAASASFYALRKWTAGGVNKHRIDMSGRTVLITGGSTGIGKETAKELAVLGADVIITVRDDQKGKATVTELQQKSGSTKVSYVVLELERLASVRKCAELLRTSGKKIDILILNAGVALVPYMLTEDGFETHMAVNHLSQFLLTRLLLKYNLINEPGRILVVSSLANEAASIDFDDLNWTKRSYGQVSAYGQSKLANVLFAKELDERLRRQNKNITAVSIHPGAVATDLGRHLHWLIRPINALFIPFLYKTVREGAQTTLHCAMAPEIPSQGGRYFADCKVKEPNKLVYDSETRARLWTMSERLVGLEDKTE